MESSRTPPFTGGDDWHRYQSVGPNPGPGDKAVPPGAVSILLNALPKTTQPSPQPSRSHNPPAGPPGTMDAPAAAEPLDIAPLGPASAGGENAAAAENAPASTRGEGERAKDTAAPETVTGSVAAPAAQEEAAPPASEEIPARLSPPQAGRSAGAKGQSGNCVTATRTRARQRAGRAAAQAARRACGRASPPRLRTAPGVSARAPLPLWRQLLAALRVLSVRVSDCRVSSAPIRRGEALPRPLGHTLRRMQGDAMRRPYEDNTRFASQPEQPLGVAAEYLDLVLIA
jgi:hypothetical protein